MASTQALCSQFKVDVLNGNHAFVASTTRATAIADNFKAALFYQTATLNASTTIYSATGEVTSTTSNYTAGGWPVTWTAPAQSTSAGTSNQVSIAYTTPTAAITITNLTAASFDTVLIYNDKDTLKRAVSVHTFGNQTITAGTFTLTMPTNDSVTGLIRIQ